MKTLTAALLLLAPAFGLAQAQTPTTAPVDLSKVSVTSRGNDVRLVLTNMFSQSKKSFILQSSIQYSLFLSLQDTDFQKALDLICEQANLKYDIRDDIYHIYKKKAPVTAPATTNTLPTLPPANDPAGIRSANTTPPIAEKAPEKKMAEKTIGAPEITATPNLGGPKNGRLSLSVLKKKVTTKLAKAPIGAVLEELGAQAGIKIEVSENVPAYRLDAILNDTTLRYALEQVTRAAKLTYTFTDHQSILVDTRGQ